MVVWLLKNGPEKGERLILNSGTLPYQEFLGKASIIFKTKAPFLKAGSLLTGIAWRLDTFFSFVFSKKPFLTKYTAKASSRRLIYNSIVLQKIWPDFRFITLEESLQWLATAKE
jgi:hypothetical protein